VQFFSDDYTTARQRFRAAAAALGWPVEAHAIEAPGPGGETLTIDVAIGQLGATQAASSAAPCLVVSSGLHGVEAFLGSALQLAVLQHWTAEAASVPPLRIVLMHALNPFGFAWLRRADQANIDLNRNFLLDGEAYRGSPPGYAELDHFLNPQHAPRRVDAFMLHALAQIARMGLPALKGAIAGGQFDFPRGLFYGGGGASRTQQIIASNLARWLGDCRQVMHLDLHSGLGKWGSYKLLIDYALRDEQRQTLRAWFGDGAFEENAARQGERQVAYATRGGFGQWCAATQRERRYLFAYAEFGAYDILRTIAALRAENQAHFWGQADDPQTRRAKLRLRELLCPASPVWRQRVVERGIALILQAARGLTRPLC
jgi:hypothetical protein